MKKRKLLLLLSILLMASCSNNNSNNNNDVNTASRAADLAMLQSLTTSLTIHFITGEYNLTFDNKDFSFNCNQNIIKLTYNEKNVITADSENLTNEDQQYTITEKVLGDILIEVCKDDFNNVPGTLTASLDIDGIMIMKYYHLLPADYSNIPTYNFSTSKLS